MSTKDVCQKLRDIYTLPEQRNNQDKKWSLTN